MSNNKIARRGRLQTPGPPPAIMGTVSRESDEASPEPSPVGPPQPQQQQQNLLLPPWTPQENQTRQQQQQQQQQKYPALDDESLPSLPDAPSPYSPPPASLFSGEEFPPKSTRKPVAEVRFQQGGALNNLSLNQATLQQQQQQRSFTSPQDNLNRSQLLPTVLCLKNDLQESHHNLFLLQQENKALAAECDRFQQEMQKWQAAAQSATSEHERALQQKIEQLQQSNAALLQENEQNREAKRQLEEQKAALQREQEKLHEKTQQANNRAAQSKQEAEKMSSELLAAKATVTRLETVQSQSLAAVEGLQAEIRDLRSKMKEQSQSAAQKLKSATIEHQQEIEALQTEKKSNQLEIDRLKAMLHEAKQKIAKGAADLEAGAQADLLYFQTAADEANAVVDELRSELTELESEFAQKECTLQDEIDSLQAALAKRNAQDAQLKKTQSESQNKIKGIQEALADATERENELLSEKDALQKELSVKIDELQQEVDSLQQEVAKTHAETENLQNALTQKNDALKESYAKYKSLRADRDKLQKEVSRLHKSPPNNAGRSSKRSPGSESKLRDDVDRLQAALHKANTKCSELRMERSTLAKELAHAKHARTDDQSVFHHQQGSLYLGGEDTLTNGGDDDLIPDRLGRIRDAAERAVLVKEYRRELQRLKSEHEAEIKRLTARHDQDLKDVFEEAKSDVSARARENRRRLQGEYEAKVAALERRYQAELTRAQRECDKNTAVAEEAMEAAASEVAAVTEQLDKETAARETLEGTVRELERKLVIESQKSKLSVEWMKSRKQWQKETNSLLASIQEECNAVFSQNMVATTSASPRTVAAVDEKESSLAAASSSLQQSSSAVNSSSVLDTSTLSNIENADPMAPLPTPWNKSKQIGAKTTSYNSPLDVTQAVDETEALVRSLLGN